MSVEPSTLERSALERKDREELTTIALALGAKPPSRARKADIVQLILELTGVESSGATSGGDESEATRAAPAQGRDANGRSKEATVDDDGDTSPAATAASAAAGGTPAPEGAPAPGASTGSTGAGQAAPVATPAEPPSEWELEFGGTTDVVASPAPGGQGPAGAGAARPEQDDPNERDDKPARGTGDARAREGQGNGNGDRHGDTKQGEGRPDVRQAQGPGDTRLAQGDQVKGDGGEGEQGNRRRRRRGRRGKDDQAHVEEFAGEPVDVEGLLDLRDEGYGFLRVKGYLASKDDIYVSAPAAPPCATRRTRPCCASTRSTASIPSRLESVAASRT
jgi:transcription termination factor Rho